MESIRVDHIGIMVRDIQAAAAAYGERIGLPTEKYLFSEKFGCTIAMVPCGSLKLELMQPAASGAGRDWLNSHGEGLHHICYTVRNLHDAFEEAKERQIDRADGLLISAEGKEAFFIRADALNGVISEFIEEDNILQEQEETPV